MLPLLCSFLLFLLFIHHHKGKTLLTAPLPLSNSEEALNIQYILTNWISEKIEYIFPKLSKDINENVLLFWTFIFTFGSKVFSSFLYFIQIPFFYVLISFSLQHLSDSAQKFWWGMAVHSSSRMKLRTD